MAQPTARRVRAALTGVGGSWGYVIGAGGGIVTFFLLFQPWIKTSGWDGKVQANAFGRIEATTKMLNIWSRTRPGITHITGIWAILACASILVTVFAVLAYLRLRTEPLARLAAAASVATAFFVLIAVVYINSKGPQLKAMTYRTWDLGGHVGAWLQWATGHGKPAIPGLRETPYTTARLTNWALLAGGTALGSALVTVTQWTHNGGSETVRRWCRSPRVQSLLRRPPPRDPED
ncbi:hypothetical protein [Nocardia sp. NPDC051832]|uniref:hypothetical protein n=1 Tax=Nocardia sp. NPDC051832 TaxID=3155673 RepID=UPI00344285D4